MNAVKAGATRHHKTHIYTGTKPLCGGGRAKSGWQATMLLEPNCKKCISIAAKIAIQHANSR